MERMFSTLVTGAAPIALVVLCGCHHAMPAMVPAPEPAPVAVATPAPKPVAAPVATTIHVSDEILAACETDNSQVRDAPKFAFDSAWLTKADRRLLGDVAACVTVGPLAGRSLTLVGRADPRGTEDYNLHLGDRRALSVERYLEHDGVAASKLIETSRGALDARGHDESGWKMDRRVDIDLAS